MMGEQLLTDKCLLSCLVIGFILILFALKRAPVRASLLSIIQRPLALSAGIVLLFFISIGVLDSIQIKSQDWVKECTILDKLLYPLGEIAEKTYSAPLALRQYVSETSFVKGRARQSYPLLIYPKTHLSSEAAKQTFIKQVIAQALLYSLGVCILLLLLPLFLWQWNAAWVSVIVTLSLLCFLTYTGYGLSRDLHILGTGQIGEDVFYYAIKSIRTALVIGLLTTLFMSPLALFLGISAGYFGGLVDDVIQYIYTTLSSIPGVLLITASVLSLQTYITNHPEYFNTLAKGADARLLALCFILGITSWTSLCRLLRAETLKLREVDFIAAALAMGSSWWTIFRKHLLPNVMYLVVITLVLDFSFLVMAEAVLSYVGVGVSPMTISWGNMINGARLELARDPIVWWPMAAAFFFMFCLVLATNLFADAVKDAFDPI